MSDSSQPADQGDASYSLNFVIENAELGRLSQVCGPLEANIDYLARRLGVAIARRGAQFNVRGSESAARLAMLMVESLYSAAETDITHETIHLQLQSRGVSGSDRCGSADKSGVGRASFTAGGMGGTPQNPPGGDSALQDATGLVGGAPQDATGLVGGASQDIAGLVGSASQNSNSSGSTFNEAAGTDEVILTTRRIQIRPRGEHQMQYVRDIQRSSLVFGVGPAGTGKTFLAVACAVQALESERVERLILVRPAVEAGERLGFLPGDLAQKVDPYLRPIYDALYQMMGFDRVTRLLEKNIIEVAPLAYMRGRTLNNAFVILDEAQNTTRLQMKMFLTRLGFGSTAVVTGDVTQVDLPLRETSGLADAVRLLGEVNGVRFTFFTRNDVVRHPLVSRIIEAYEADHV